MGTAMNLKLLTAVAIFATAPIVTFAQNGDPADQAPKPTLADAENVVQTISSDKTSSKRFASWVSFQIRCRKLKTETILKESTHLSLKPILSHSK
jgi:hypothetical protein